MKKVYLLLLGASFAIAGCDSSDDDSTSTSTSTSTGIILDSPVVNIGYKTETLEGVTDTLGQYNYIEGESVIFSIGDLVFPAVTASGTITPLDIAGTTDTSNPQVINMIRLLQSIDEDGDPSNGITITETAKEVATPVDFNLPVDEFAASTAVTGLVSNSGSSKTTLISQSAAIGHFEETLSEEGVEFIPNATIIGTWKAYDDENEILILIFFDDGTYIHAEVDVADLDEESGMEWGTYTLDNETGVISSEQTFDANGETGLSDVEIITAQVAGNQLTITASDVDEPIVFSRITSEGLLGTWVSEQTENDLLVFIYLDGGTYIHIEVDSDDVDEVSGMEWANYTINSETGELTVTGFIFDENGDTGLNDIDSLFVDVDGDVMTYEVTEPGGNESDTIVFARQ